MAVLHVHRVEKHKGSLRRQEISEMYLTGMTQEAIGRQLGITQKAVSKQLARAREIWIAQTTRNYAEKVAEELAGLDLIMVKAWSAYERSLRPLKKGAAERVGDIRCLEAVLRAREMRLKVLGALRGNQVLVNQTVVNWDSLLTAAREERGRSPDVIEGKLAALEERLQSESASVNGTPRETSD
jgi:predicted transcriptional regulator